MTNDKSSDFRVLRLHLAVDENTARRLVTAFEADGQIKRALTRWECRRHTP